MKVVTGLTITGRVMSVDEPRNFSGIAKGSGKPYSMNRRRFQLFANKHLYDCQDARDDEKHLVTGAVVVAGVDRFPAIYEGDLITLPVLEIEVAGKIEAKAFTYTCDTTLI